MSSNITKFPRMVKMWLRIPTVPFNLLGSIVPASIFANLLLSIYISGQIGAWVSKLVYAAVPSVIGVEKVYCMFSRPDN